MIAVRPESVVRWLDDLDAFAFALRLLWAGAQTRLLARLGLLAAGMAGALFMSAVAAG